ncbi:MAG: protein kinase, partial [Chloroflexota bacterium]
MLKRINGRYELLNQIGSGGMGDVFKAYDRLADETVALKRVSLADDGGRLNTFTYNETQKDRMLLLAKEFEILAGLRHPNIISVLDYGFDAQNQPYYTMVYLDDSETILEAGEKLDIVGKIDLIEQLLQGLAYLHRRGILHRDIKPENVLVSQGRVNLLDFGLSHKTGGEGTRGGSPQYVAPEILVSSVATKAADLYAVGVLLYQFLTGNHPFGEMDLYFYERLLKSEPNWESVDEAWRPLLNALFSKSSAGRPQSASEILRVLIEEMGRPAPTETPAIRESYLQAAKFVGREKELSLLQEALDSAYAGRGSIWLLGGESGVGKSRLLSELRTQALVQGFQILLGRELSESNEDAYRLWREPLRHLLSAAPEVSELAAGVLLPIVPDIGKLLGRPVTPAPKLGEKETRLRLYSTIAQCFWDAKRPLLLILEDLHWGSESLQPHPHFARFADQYPLVIVGSYRNDERPNLLEALSHTTRLTLSRLTRDEMAELSRAMLGEVGKKQEIIDLIHRETEGNTFFAVEVVRALAEDAGTLKNIGEMTLPKTLLPNGIRDVVERRLRRIEEAEKHLLIKAAVAGRELDLRLIDQLNSGLDLDIENRWLPMCAEAVILEIQNGVWQFTHAKIRDGLLAELSKREKIDLHREIGSALETLYPEEERPAARLAYHWQVGGDLEKERAYAMLAGKQAADQYAHWDALRFYERVIELTSEDDYLTLYELYFHCFTAYHWMGIVEKEDETLIHLTALAEKLRDKSKQVTVLIKKGDVLYGRSHFDEAKKVHRQAAEIARAHQLVDLEAWALDGLAWVASLQNDFDECIETLRQASLLSDQLDNPDLQVRLNNTYGVFKSQTGNLRESLLYYEENLALSLAHSNLVQVEVALFSIADTYKSLGEFELAKTYFQQSLEMTKQMG